MNLNVNPIRMDIQGFGPLLGKRLVTVRFENIDLNYNEKLQKDPYGLPAKPFKKYFCEYHDITAIEALILPDGKKVIEFNKNPKLQFALKEPKFYDVSTDAITKAVESSTPIFFSDYKACSEQVQLMNERVASDIENMMNVLMNQIEVLKSINSQEKASYLEYADSLNKSIPNNLQQ